MTKILIVNALLLIAIFTLQVNVKAQSISPTEANKLIAFLKERMGNFVPPNANIEVKGYQTTPLKGFKQGTISITTEKGSGDVPYLISDDKKYLIFGEPADTTTFQDSPLGLKQGKIKIGSGPPIPVLISKDGRYLVIGGELIEYKLNSSN